MLVSSCAGNYQYACHIVANFAQDYLIAQGMGKLMPGQLLRTALKYSFSQDGVKWVDLEALSDEVASKAAGITGMLSGEPAKAYTVQVPGAAPVAEEEVTAGHDMYKCCFAFYARLLQANKQLLLAISCICTKPSTFVLDCGSSSG